MGTTDADLTLARCSVLHAGEALLTSTEWLEHAAELRLDLALDAAQKTMIAGHNASGIAPLSRGIRMPPARSAGADVVWLGRNISRQQRQAFGSP